MKKPHVRARTNVEVHRVFHIRAFSKVLTAADDGMLRQMGHQIENHCNLMLDPYIKQQIARSKAVRARRKK